MYLSMVDALGRTREMEISQKEENPTMLHFGRSQQMRWRAMIGNKEEEQAAIQHHEKPKEAWQPQSKPWHLWSKSNSANLTWDPVFPQEASLSQVSNSKKEKESGKKRMG